MSTTFFNTNPASATGSNPQPSIFGFQAAQPSAVANPFQNAVPSQPNNVLGAGVSQPFSFPAPSNTSQNFFNVAQPQQSQAPFQAFNQAQQPQQGAIQAAQVVQPVQPQPQLPGPLTPDYELVLLQKAISSPEVFGDERDAIIAKLNGVQVSRGFGLAYFSANNAPLKITPENPWYRFRTITYVSIGVLSSSSGTNAPTPVDFYDTPPNNDTVVLAFDGAAGELLKTPSSQNAVMGVLTDVFAQLQQKGLAPALHATVEGIRTLSDTRVELHLRVLMRDPSSAPPAAPPAPATFFGQQPQQQQPAAAQNYPLRPAPVQQVADLLCRAEVLNYIQTKLSNTPLLIYPKFAVTDEMIREYLASPPAGTRKLLTEFFGSLFLCYSCRLHASCCL